MGVIVLGGRNVEVPGVACSGLRQLQRHVTPRRLPIRNVMLHTSTGQRVELVTRTGGSTAAESLVEYFGRTEREASADFAVDGDSIAQDNDPLQFYTWGSGPSNPSAVQIEMTVLDGRYIDSRTMFNTVRLVDVLTGALGIQRQIAWRDGAPVLAPIPRLVSGGASLVGVYGHVNSTTHGERGQWDPGARIFELLAEAQYERFDVNAGQDLATWRERQASLGLTPDGVPGARTRDALAARGYPCGIWVRRPVGCGAAQDDAGGLLKPLAIAAVAGIAGYAAHRAGWV